MQRADQRKYHYIYKITRDDGRYYIGMHSTDDLKDGYFGSGKLITRSIKKYGKERHKKEIVEHLPSRQTLKDREKELITEDLRADVMCMNIAPGGGGGFINDAHREKFRASSTVGGKKAGPVNIAKVNTLATAISKRTETKKIKGGSLFGFGLPSFGIGSKHAATTKQKMSISQTGTKNSQFGTCWVNDGKITSKVKREELRSYLERGFQQGRLKKPLTPDK